MIKKRFNGCIANAQNALKFSSVILTMQYLKQMICLNEAQKNELQL